MFFMFTILCIQNTDRRGHNLNPTRALLSDISVAMGCFSLFNLSVCTVQGRQVVL